MNTQPFDEDEAATITTAATIPADLNLWQWADANVVFSDHYPTARRGKYSIAFVPFWREPMEAFNRRDVKEIVILAAAQSGKTEQMLLMPVRFNTARNPVPTMYVGASQSQVEAVWDERIKPALRDMKATRLLLKTARQKEHEIYFPNGATLAITWATSVAGLKSRPVHTVLLDEVSVFEEDAISKVRLRTRTYPFPKIVICSTPDAKHTASGDPILQEYANTDRREYFMPDPKTGHPFKFEMGTVDGTGATAHGLKWDPAAKTEAGWDLNMVKKSAFYRTPDGTEIRDADKPALLSAGSWVATNTNAPADRRGYHVSAFLLPWVSFGEIAAAFVQSTEAGRAHLRVFVHEWLAEAWHEDREAIYADKVCAREVAYEPGQRFSTIEPWKTLHVKKDNVVFVTMDVQKNEIYWLAREWIAGGDSALIAWGTAVDWLQVSAVLDRFDPYSALVDMGYSERRLEVLEQSSALRMVPTRGEPRPMMVPYQERMLNIYEGTTRQREDRKIKTLVFAPDYFKDMLADRINGRTRPWHVYRGIDPDYQRQVTAEEKVGGRWQKKRGSPANHLWDCEILSLLAAVVFGFAQEVPMEITQPNAATMQPE